MGIRGEQVVVVLRQRKTPNVEGDQYLEKMVTLS